MDLTVPKHEAKEEGRGEGRGEGKVEAALVMLSYVMSLSSEKIQEFTSRMKILDLSAADEFIAFARDFKYEDDIEKWICEKEKKVSKSKAA